MWALAAIVAVVLIAGVVQFVLQSRPLTDAELYRAADGMRQSLLDQFVSFDRSRRALDTEFKASMKADGRWHSVNIPLEHALAVIASHLKYKKHEWLIFALVRDRVVVRMWCNKGPDGTQVPSKVPVSELLAAARSVSANLILDAHNHPNPNPSRYNALCESDADRVFAEAWGMQLSAQDITLLSAVCERGDWFIFDRRLAPSLFPFATLLAQASRENATTWAANRRLRRHIKYTPVDTSAPLRVHRRARK